MSENEDDKARLLALKNDYRDVFVNGGATAAQCRNVLLDILQMSRILDSDYIAHDPEGSAFQAGQKRLARLILDLLDLNGYSELLEMSDHGINLFRLNNSEES